MIHDRADLRDGDYFACSRPEAPPTVDCTYDDDCRACVLVLGSHALHDDETVLFEVETNLDDGTGRELYERLRGHHGLPPLPERVS